MSYPDTHWMEICRQPWYGRSKVKERPNTGAKWSEDEEQKLLTAWRMGNTACEIADVHGRTPTAIVSKLETLFGGRYPDWHANPAKKLPLSLEKRYIKETSAGMAEACLKAKLQQLAKLDQMRETVVREIAELRDMLDDPLPPAFAGDPYDDRPQAAQEAGAQAG